MITQLRNPLAHFRARRIEQAAVQQAQDDTRRLAQLGRQRRRARDMRRLLERTRVAVAGGFVIADLETTGFSSNDEIIELAAIRVPEQGGDFYEFSTLVQIDGHIPERVAGLTGISNKMVAARGAPLDRAMLAFMDFCGQQPLFFHNAGFDARFVRAACETLDLPFDNEVHCTLKVARAAWPELKSHKLLQLARHVGAPTPTHRGLDDVRTTLFVLMQALQVTPPPAAA